MRGSRVKQFVDEFIEHGSEPTWYNVLANFGLQQMVFVDPDGKLITMTWNTDIEEYDVTMN
jgi:predicted lactoylglutathione lyase